MNKIKEIKDSINTNISSIIKDEFIFANYAVNQKDNNVSFTDVLIKMKELKYAFMKLDKDLSEIG